MPYWTEIQYTGGAKIGIVNANWPLAKLTADSQKLKLNVTFIGKYEFEKAQILNIKKVGFIPLIGTGIKIEHTVADYPRNINFYAFSSPYKVMERLSDVGFFTSEKSVNCESSAQNKGIPVKVLPTIVAIFTWNFLFLADQGFFMGKTVGIEGLFTQIAFILVFGTSLAVKKFPLASNIFLKPGRSVNEISPILNLLILVSGLFFVIDLLTVF